MFKPSLVIAFLAATALSPAYAAPDLCNDAHMQMDDMIAKMTDATKKKEATTHPGVAFSKSHPT